MKKRILLLTVALALCLRVSAAVPPAEKLLPDDTLAMLTVPDFHNFLVICSNSPQAQLWHDPSMQAFRTKLTDQIKSTLITPLEHDLGIHFDDYTSLPQGQLTFAMVQNGWQGRDEDKNQPGFVMLLDTKDKSAQLKSNLADLKKKWADASKNIKTEKIRDIEFSAVTLSSSDLPKTLRPPADGGPDSPEPGHKPASSDDGPGGSAGKTTVYIGQSDSLLVIANAPKVIEKILNAQSGGGITTLSEEPTFVANQNALFRNAAAYGWVNLRKFVTLEKNSATPSADDSTPSVDKIVAALGLDGLRSAAFAYVSSDDGSQLNFQLTVPEDARSGIFKLLAGEPKDCNPPAFVPADAVKFSRYRLDGNKFWQGLRKIVGDISPQSQGGLDFLIDSANENAKEKNPDFDIKKDLFGNLGDDFITYQKLPKNDAPAEAGSAPTIVLVGSPNPTRLATALNALLVLAGPQGGQPKEREFLGHKIYSLPLPMLAAAMPAAAGGGPGAPTPTLSYASSAGYLALSMDGTMIEEFLRSGTQDDVKTLNDLPGLSAAKQKISDGGTSFFTYENDSEAARVLLKTIKSEAGADAIETQFEMFTMLSGVGSNVKFKDWVDFSLLPGYDRISKYFSFTVGAAGATPDGLVYKMYFPTPAQLKK